MLAADHADAAGGDGEGGDEVGVDGGVFIRLFGDEALEGEGLQGIADQDGGGLVVGFPDRRLAAAEFVVIHGGEVIVNERVAVNALDGGCGFYCCCGRAAKKCGSFEDEKWSEAFTSSENSVAHRLTEAVGRSLILLVIDDGAQMRFNALGGVF